MVRNASPSILLLIFLHCLFLKAIAFSQSLIQHPATYKASFNCTGIKEQTAEDAVCHHEDLAKLDLEMADIYQKRLASADASQRDALIQSQRKWLTIRDMHKFYGKLSDQEGMASDLADFYKERIAALQSQDQSLLEPKLPPEYEWLKSFATDGFSSEAFLVREYMGCQDPCERKSALYRVVGLWGNGTGEPPGNTQTQYSLVVKKLQKDGWKKCREADDSGKPDIEYFTKQDKMLSLSSYASMGTGNTIEITVTTSGPLPRPKEVISNPPAQVEPDWQEYKSSDGILSLKYPPHWRMRKDISSESGLTKSLRFQADDSSGGFGLILNENWQRPKDRDCVPSPYKIEGEAAEACLVSVESVGTDTCYRYIESLNAYKNALHLSFWPDYLDGSEVRDSRHFKLTHIYETILSTVELR